MTEKYYTPTIEEFFVGYEYEYKTHDGVNYSEEEFNKKPWIKSIYGFNDFPYVDRTMNGRMQHQTVRVKYLDQGDIESLGWILSDRVKNTPDRIHFYRIETVEYDFAPDFYDLRHNLIFCPERDKPLVIISLEMLPGHFSYVFHGYCKSINELKTVLKLIPQ